MMMMILIMMMTAMMIEDDGDSVDDDGVDEYDENDVYVDENMISMMIVVKHIRTYYKKYHSIIVRTVSLPAPIAFATLEFAPSAPMI